MSKDELLVRPFGLAGQEPRTEAQQQLTANSRQKASKRKPESPLANEPYGRDFPPGLSYSTRTTTHVMSSKWGNSIERLSNVRREIRKGDKFECSIGDVNTSGNQRGDVNCKGLVIERIVSEI